MADIDQMTEAGMGLALGRPLVGFVDEFGAIINWVSGGTAKFVPRTAPGAIYATATELDGIEGYHDPEEFRRHTVALLECVVQAEQLSREEIEESLTMKVAGLSIKRRANGIATAALRFDDIDVTEQYSILKEREAIRVVRGLAMACLDPRNNGKEPLRNIQLGTILGYKDPKKMYKDARKEIPKGATVTLGPIGVVQK